LYKHVALTVENIKKHDGKMIKSSVNNHVKDEGGIFSRIITRVTEKYHAISESI